MLAQSPPCLSSLVPEMSTAACAHQHLSPLPEHWSKVLLSFRSAGAQMVIFVSHLYMERRFLSPYLVGAFHCHQDLRTALQLPLYFSKTLASFFFLSSVPVLRVLSPSAWARFGYMHMVTISSVLHLDL